jgi:hypothetical protein
VVGVLFVYLFIYFILFFIFLTFLSDMTVATKRQSTKKEKHIATTSGGVSSLEWKKTQKGARKKKKMKIKIRIFT